MVPIRVGIREARINLSRLLKEVRRGTEVVIVDRGTPVGRIVPVSGTTTSVAERVRELELRGLIEPQRPRPRNPNLLPLPIPKDLAQKILQEDREG